MVCELPHFVRAKPFQKQDLGELLYDPHGEKILCALGAFARDISREAAKNAKKAMFVSRLISDKDHG